MSEKSRFILRNGLGWGAWMFVIMGLVNAFLLEDPAYVLRLRYVLISGVSFALGGLFYGWWTWRLARSRAETEAYWDERLSD